MWADNALVFPSWIENEELISTLELYRCFSKWKIPPTWQTFWCVVSTLLQHTRQREPQTIEPAKLLGSALVILVLKAVRAVVIKHKGANCNHKETHENHQPNFNLKGIHKLKKVELFVGALFEQHIFREEHVRDGELDDFRSLQWRGSSGNCHISFLKLKARCYMFAWRGRYWYNYRFMSDITTYFTLSYFRSTKTAAEILAFFVSITHPFLFNFAWSCVNMKN